MKNKTNFLSPGEMQFLLSDEQLIRIFCAEIACKSQSTDPYHTAEMLIKFIYSTSEPT